MTVRIHYFRSSPPNFGDELNTFVWPLLIPELARTARDGVLVGIGTIFNSDVPVDREVFVIGAGAGLAALPHLRCGNIRVLAVRGPLTAALAGLPSELAVTDGALLLRDLYPELIRPPGRASNGRAVFIPHFTTAHDAGWRRACERAGIDLVVPTDDCESVLRKISSARLVIAEAMHGAIVADAFRVPWIPVASTRHFSTFKWVDWALSLRVPFKPVLLPAVSARHACQRGWLSLTAERFLSEGACLSGRDAEADAQAVSRLLDEARARLESPRRPMGKWIGLKAAAVYNRIVDPTMAELGNHVLRPVNDRLERRAAKLLAELANSDGYRSDDAVSDERLQCLRNKVQWLRDRLSLSAAVAETCEAPRRLA